MRTSKRGIELLIGRRFGRLTVLRRAPKRPPCRKPRLICLCDCGNETDVRATDLRRTDGREVRSCGCLAKPHGMRNAPEYRAWNGLIRRCECPTNKDFHKYGGRGVRVCQRWRESFAAFYADMGPRPSPRHSIDRIDNDGHYEPGNRRWATVTQHGNNRRTNVLVWFPDETVSMKDGARKLGISYHAMKWLCGREAKQLRKKRMAQNARAA